MKKQVSMAFVVAVAAMLFSTSVSASWFSQAVDAGKKTIEKPGKWVAKQSGLKPTVDNANDSMKSVTQAADKLKDISPAAIVAVQSITRTSDIAGNVLVTIKWPVVISAYLLALWLASLAINGWKKRTGEEETRAESPDLRRALKPTAGFNLPRSGRFLLIALGSLLVFLAMFAIELLRNPSLNLDAHLAPYLAVAALRSAAAGAALCWFKLQHRWAGLALGIAAGVLMFAVIAVVPSDLDVQPKTEHQTQTP